MERSNLERSKHGSMYMSGSTLRREIHRARRALHRRLRDRFSRVVAEELKNAPRALGLSVDEHAAACFEGAHTEVICTFTLCAIKPIKKRSEIDGLRAVLEEVAVCNGAL